MTPAELRAEIVNDPESIGYAAPWAAGADTDLAALLNAPGAGPVNRREVPRGELLEALAGAGGLGPIYAAAADPLGAAFNVCKAATLVLDDPAGTVDYTRPGTRALVAALGPGTVEQPMLGVLTAPQLAALQAVCVKQGSRAEVLWGDGAAVTASDVAEARKVGD